MMMQGFSANVNASSVKRETEADTKENAVAFTCVGIASLLDPFDEDAEVAEKPTLRDLYSNHFGVQDSGPREKDDNVDEREKVEDYVQYSLKKELWGLAVISATFDCLCILGDELQKTFWMYKRQSRLRKAKEMTEATIRDHFRLP